MYIIGLKGCVDCHKYFAIHPEHKYVELEKGKSYKEGKILEIKKALGKLNFDMKFPVLLSEDMKTLIPRKKLIQELKMKSNRRTSGCRHCGGR